MPSAAYEKLRDRAWQAWQPWEESAVPRVTVGISACSLSVGAGETLAIIRREVQRLGLEAQLIEVGDIGFCWAEPVVGVAHPGEPFVLYGPVTPETAPRFVADVLVARLPRRDVALGTLGKGTVEGIPPLSEQPWMRHQRRLVMRNFGITEPGNLDHYVAKGGYWSLDKALFEMKPVQVIDEVKASNLRGRGGAVFPTGTKWGFMTNAPAPKYLAVNGEEGDPGAFTDKGIVENDPHMLLEGALIAAYAMGCTKTFIHIRAEYFLAVQRLRRAVQELEEAGLVGHKIMGSDFNHEIEIEATGHAYICGEETALMESVEGKRGAPRPRPPFPAQYGIFGRPTNVNNVKTISYVPSLIEMGGAAFAKIGTQNASGTALLSLSGHINRRGIAEVPIGTNLKAVIEDVAGGVRGGKKAKALQTGGPLGGLMAASEMDVIAEFQAMSAKGSPLGSGGILVMDEDTCVVEMTKNVMEFNEEESCGKCFPCRTGTTHIVRIFDGIVRGLGQEGDIEKLQEIGRTMVAGSLCGLGQLAPNGLNATLRYFRDEYEEHIRDKRCRTGTCRELRGPGREAATVSSRAAGNPAR